MDGEIETTLASAAEAMREYELVTRRRDELRARAKELTGRIANLRAEHEAEQRDVERLEGLSLARVWSALRGSRADDLERERAEADAARYRVAEAQAQLAAIERELAAAEARLGELAEAPATYAAALDAKEAYLRQSGDPRGARLLELADERGQLAAQQREVGEAIAAAQRAAEALGQVRTLLGSAANWSTYDTFLGGGLIGSAIKHSRMDEAAQAAARADACLLTLRTELAGVAGIELTAPRLATDGLTRFVDIWFDNIFTDLAVREGIRQAQHSVDQSSRLVADVRHRLAERDARDRDRLAAIETERRDLLTQA